MWKVEALLVKIKNHIDKNRIMLIFEFLMVAVIFLLLFSWETSPFSDFTSKDSSIFRLTGQLWDKGRIPYLDFFEQKGPFIFFIEWLCCQISYNKIGIFVVQVVFLLVTLCGVYKIFRLFLEKRDSVIWTILNLLILNIYFDGGNLTEEYCLPFITWSIYFIFKYLYKEEQNRYAHYVLYGMTFAICLLTRATNFMPIIVALISVISFEKMCISKIIKNLLVFFTTFIVITMPFLIYFSIHNALYEMFYGTILFNVFYVTGGGYSVSTIEHIKMIIYSIPLMSVAVISILNFRKYKRVSITLLAMSLVSVVMALYLRPYPHYLVVWIPMIAVAIGILCKKNITVEICTMHKTQNIETWKKWIIGIMCALSVGIITGKNTLLVKENYEKHTSDYMAIYTREAKKIDGMIPDRDKDSVLAYNVEPTYYLVTETIPCYKYCFLQDLQSIVDDRMRLEFEDEIKSCKVKYIITRKNKINKLDSILEKNYETIGQTNLFIVKQLMK